MSRLTHIENITELIRIFTYDLSIEFVNLSNCTTRLEIHTRRFTGKKYIYIYIYVIIVYLLRNHIFDLIVLMYRMDLIVDSYNHLLNYYYYCY